MGDSVIALLNAKEGIVKSFGVGTYAGRFEHPTFGFLNPRIDLPNGKHVWGCECWWGPEEAVREKFKNWKWTEVDIDEERKRAGVDEPSVTINVTINKSS